MIMNDGNTPPGLISIRFLSGPLAGQTFPIRKPSVTIGRGEINDIVVRSDQKVSRSHARLRWNGSSWSILDETQIAYNLPSIKVSSNIHNTRQSYPLTKEVMNIGRDASNDIPIEDGNIVSSLHLQIIRQNGQFALIHPHPDRPRTLNGLLYQGRAIHGDEPFRKTLTNGDIFRIGDENGTLFSIYSQSDATQRILLAWACLGGIVLLLLITIGLALKAKDVRK